MMFLGNLRASWGLVRFNVDKSMTQVSLIRRNNATRTSGSKQPHFEAVPLEDIWQTSEAPAFASLVRPHADYWTSCLITEAPCPATLVDVLSRRSKVGQHVLAQHLKSCFKGGSLQIQTKRKSTPESSGSDCVVLP